MPNRPGQGRPLGGAMIYNEAEIRYFLIANGDGGSLKNK
jgi:hypothetical protein